MDRKVDMYPDEYDGYKVPKGIKIETDETKRLLEAAEAELAELTATILARHGK